MAKAETIRDAVKEAYASLARDFEQSCCDSKKTDKLVRYGYSSDESQG